jgi:hypothetical protein
MTIPIAPSVHERRLIPSYLEHDRGPGGVPIDGIDAAPVKVLQIRGAAVVTFGQVRNVGPAAVPLIGVDKFRRFVELKNIGTNDCYIGPDPQVTIETGWLLGPADPPKGFAITGALFALTPSGFTTVCWHAETDA